MVDRFERIFIVLIINVKVMSREMMRGNETVI